MKRRSFLFTLLALLGIKAPTKAQQINKAVQQTARLVALDVEAGGLSRRAVFVYETAEGKKLTHWIDLK